MELEMNKLQEKIDNYLSKPNIKKEWDELAQVQLRPGLWKIGNLLTGDGGGVITYPSIPYQPSPYPVTYSIGVGTSKTIIE